MTTKQDIVECAKSKLEPFFSVSGGLLYSSHETLRRGDIYFLGYNPGGNGGDCIGDSIDHMLQYTDNAYLDESWADSRGAYPKGEARLQKRVQWLLESLGYNTRSVCASNLIFMRSRDAAGVDHALADVCWPVHEEILELVQPRIILTFGNSDVSPFQYLHNKFGGLQVQTPCGHGSWTVKAFRTTIRGRTIQVVGVPHLSRYSPIGRLEVVNWIKDRMRLPAVANTTLPMSRTVPA
jgi:hypothetical protein